MIQITDKPISPEIVINSVKSDSSGCIAAYIGLIRDYSKGKKVVSVEYKDTNGTAETKLRQIAEEATRKWQINGMSIIHRTGKLKVGDINLAVAISAAHREASFTACEYAINQFKQDLPTWKKETYEDNSFSIEG